MDTEQCVNCGFAASRIVEGLCDDCWEQRQQEEDQNWQEYMEGEFGRNYTDGIGY
jgi:hypothetical protein